MRVCVRPLCSVYQQSQIGRMNERRKNYCECQTEAKAKEVGRARRIGAHARKGRMNAANQSMSESKRTRTLGIKSVVQWLSGAEEEKTARTKHLT